MAATLCPSVPAREATVFLGMITSAGRIAYLQPPMPTSPALLDRLDDGSGSLESRYRFAGPCVRQQCPFYASRRCGLARSLAEAWVDLVGTGGRSEPPRCGLRGSCRWYAEQGADACSGCGVFVPVVEAEAAGDLADQDTA